MVFDLNILKNTKNIAKNLETKLEIKTKLH